jgi:uncharacterized protein (DUF488 family)
MANPYFTIGHSTRSLEEFAALLTDSNVTRLIDVRSMPRSRTNPQFNGEGLAEALAPWQIGYEHIAALGGLRGKQPLYRESLNTYWRVRSFRNYADYALTPAFTTGLAQLRRQGEQFRCAIMCAETLWWRCHRRIIADYLLACGDTVFHILGPSQIEPALLTPSAVARKDHTIIYPGAEQRPLSDARAE